MKASELFFPTLREVPAEAELVSHQLLLRGGFIRKVSAGIYSYLPLGWRVIRKVEQIIREEMDAKGGQEIRMPALIPGELLEESGRWETMGPILFKLKDRNGRDYCLGPTHEEVVTDIVRKEIRSYRQLPLMLYQIQTKYRDEPRPRGGLIRAREFIMKDLYSFDRNREGLDRSYDKMYQAYCNLFDRCGLNYRIVEADPGAIGGSDTREFHVPISSGEDVLIFCEECDYAANLELAEVGGIPPCNECCEEPLGKIETPGMKTIEQVTSFLDIDASHLIKTLIFVADGKPVAALVRGDRELNPVKLQRVLKAESLEMADPETVINLTHAPVGFAGPVGLEGVQIIADLEVAAMSCGITGANEADMHYLHVTPNRDFIIDEIADIRNASEGDLCPRCGGKLREERGVEIGHIFKLGTKYSEAMDAKYLDEDGNEQTIVMGCYGTGVTRIVSSVVETHHDQNGIIWPASIAPFQVVILAMNLSDETQASAAHQIYSDLQAAGVDVLLDDRDERAGVKFKDADLIGIPVQIVVGRLAKDGKVEFRVRGQENSAEITIDTVLSGTQAILNELMPKIRFE